MRDRDRPNAHRVNQFTCLGCGTTLDGIFAVDGSFAPPKNGDFSACRKCNHVAVFVAGPFGYTLRPLNVDERWEYEQMVEETLNIDDRPLPKLPPPPWAK